MTLEGFFIGVTFAVIVLIAGLIISRSGKSGNND